MLRTISITAHKRPYYLTEVLSGLSRALELSHEKYDVLVHCDPHERTDESLALIKKHGFRASVFGTRVGVNNATLLALSSAFGNGARYHVHFEEDTPPTQDALLWFEWAEQFGSNPQVYSVTAYNREVDGELDEARYRIWFHPWGFATWSHRWPDIIWPPDLGVISWDAAINEKYRRNDWYEIYPAVSRTQNIGESEGAYVPSPEWHRQNMRVLVTAGSSSIKEFKLRV